MENPLTLLEGLPLWGKILAGLVILAIILLIWQPWNSSTASTSSVAVTATPSTAVQVPTAPSAPTSPTVTPTSPSVPVTTPYVPYVAPTTITPAAATTAPVYKLKVGGYTVPLATVTPSNTGGGTTTRTSPQTVQSAVPSNFYPQDWAQIGLPAPAVGTPVGNGVAGQYTLYGE